MALEALHQVEEGKLNKEAIKKVILATDRQDLADLKDTVDSQAKTLDAKKLLEKMKVQTLIDILNEPEVKDVKWDKDLQKSYRYVFALQYGLSSFGYDVGSNGIDTGWGAGTSAALKQFQIDYNNTFNNTAGFVKIDEDGKPGPQSVGAIKFALTVLSPAVVSQKAPEVTRDELALEEFAKILTAKLEGEELATIEIESIIYDDMQNSIIVNTNLGEFALEETSISKIDYDSDNLEAFVDFLNLNKDNIVAMLNGKVLSDINVQN